MRYTRNKELKKNGFSGEIGTQNGSIWKPTNEGKLTEIRGLFEDSGHWSEDDSKMAEIANTYFHNLFLSSKPNMESIEKILEAIPSCVTEEQNTMLLRQFSREEIYGVIKNMHPTKAPGPDGI